MPNDSGKISIGVGLMPLVVSEKTGKVGQPIALQLITGLTPSGIVWRCGTKDVPTPENLQIVFDEAGTYIPVILGYPQHSSYAITITE